MYYMLMALVLVTGASIAQNSNTTNSTGASNEWAKKRTGDLEKYISLTPSQESHINAINIKYADKLHTFMGTHPDDAALQKYCDDMFNARLEDYNDVLTTDQRDRIKAFKDKLRADESAREKMEMKQMHE